MAKRLSGRSHLSVTSAFKVGAVLFLIGYFLLSGTLSYAPMLGMPLLILLFQHRRQRLQMRANSRAAQKIAGAPFVLYLRPFRAPSRFVTRVRAKHYTERMILGEFWDLELAVSYAVSEDAHTVAIGDPSRSIGALKVTSDDATWKDKFRALSATAVAIVMVPSPSKSVLWEAGELVRNEALCGKTLVLMPPRILRIGAVMSLLTGRGPGRFWERARVSFREVGVELPAYSPAGAVLQFDTDGKVARTIHPEWFAPDLMRQLVADPEAEPPKVRKSWWDRFPVNLSGLHPRLFAVTATVGAVFVPLWLVFLTFVYELRSIPSESMIPAVQVGDRVAVAKFAYGYNRNSIPFGFGTLLMDDDKDNPGELWSGSIPRRGDIVVFQHPFNERTMIKRVIGLPGDLVQIKGGRLFLNGQEVPREEPRRASYVTDNNLLQTAIEYREQLPGEKQPHLIHDFSDTADLDDTPVFKVPPGHVFMMGDNRDNSEDSRAPSGHRDLAMQFAEAWPYRSFNPSQPVADDAIGYVPIDYLIGRVETVLFTLHSCKKVEGAECPSNRVWRPL